jgi:hypothetical protein
MFAFGNGSIVKKEKSGLTPLLSWRLLGPFQILKDGLMCCAVVPLHFLTVSLLASFNDGSAEIVISIPSHALL